MGCDDFFLQIIKILVLYIFFLVFGPAWWGLP